MRSERQLGQIDILYIEGNRFSGKIQEMKSGVNCSFVRDKDNIFYHELKHNTPERQLRQIDAIHSNCFYDQIKSASSFFFNGVNCGFM